MTTIRQKAAANVFFNHRDDLFIRFKICFKDGFQVLFRRLDAFVSLIEHLGAKGAEIHLGVGFGFKVPMKTVE